MLVRCDILMGQLTRWNLIRQATSCSGQGRTYLVEDRAFVRKERRRLHRLLRRLLNNPDPVEKRWARDLAVYLGETPISDWWHLVQHKTYHDNLLAPVRQIHIDNMGHAVNMSKHTISNAPTSTRKASRRTKLTYWTEPQRKDSGGDNGSYGPLVDITLAQTGETRPYRETGSDRQIC
ncbi:hypothetical protein BU26DRAFT_13713 [Trematosphaeria pertusa]|uniref:Uncharacterized protein n=1 Tax=Trematosphaeria pertusa TaxID=390896 RepID=A0A6A6J013_9PLEO|nr:uncharacterized protein BU26DRAFT_13713 [Trematosphaeria pertusa]KAF2256054.1 hypothetical protein BU26DRAFT_13713 [Trematosphaeria pertusa]